jgi:hypothetical protein
MSIVEGPPGSLRGRHGTGSSEEATTGPGENGLEGVGNSDLVLR